MIFFNFSAFDGNLVLVDDGDAVHVFYILEQLVIEQHDHTHFVSSTLPNSFKKVTCFSNFFSVFWIVLVRSLAPLP